MSTTHFSKLTTTTKPCWLTEWGFGNKSESCPVDEMKRIQLIKVELEAFKPFINDGRLAAAIYFAWSKDPIFSVFRCGSITEAGKLALSLN